eukprot:9002129-Karenia_brevis.AAC.1
MLRLDSTDTLVAAELAQELRYQSAVAAEVTGHGDSQSSNVPGFSGYAAPLAALSLGILLRCRRRH